MALPENVPGRVAAHGNLRAAVLTTIKSPDARVAAILDQLAAHGVRRTAARQAILEAFFAAESHVTAEDIAAEVHRRFPSVDVSTVYRTLDTLEQLGIIDHTHLAHGPPIFHPADAHN